MAHAQVEECFEIGCQFGHQWDVSMDYSTHKQRLIDLERHLTSRVGADTALGREQSEKAVGDSGDTSVASENASQDFTQAEFGSTVLAQVREALKRIEAGTFGSCTVDGGPIEAKRLEASPWVPYCLEHQKLLEADGAEQFPTM